MPQHPSMSFAALKKVEAVLVLAREDQEFYRKLCENPPHAITEGGIDMTSNEIDAVIDVVLNRHNSKFNEKPLTSNLDKMAVLRTQWSRITQSYTKA